MELPASGYVKVPPSALSQPGLQYIPTLTEELARAERLMLGSVLELVELVDTTTRLPAYCRTGVTKS